MTHEGSSHCETAGEEAQVGEPDPCCRAVNGRLEIFGQASAAAEPGEAALNDPSPGQELKAFDPGRAFDDLNRPGAAIGHGLLQLPSAIDAIGEDMSQLGKVLPQGTQQRY